MGAVAQSTRNPYELASGSDALVLITDWPEFADLDLEALAQAMRTPLFLDGRNALDPMRVRDAGLAYVGVGRATLPASAAATGAERVPLGTPAPVGG